MSETCTLRDILDGKVAKENVIAIWQPIAHIEPFNETKDHYKVYYWDDYLQGDERIIVDIDHEFHLLTSTENAALRAQVTRLRAFVERVADSTFEDDYYSKEEYKCDAVDTWQDQAKTLLSSLAEGKRVSEETLIVYNAQWVDQKEPEYYGLFKTLEGAQKTCQEHSRKKLKWSQTKNGSWVAGDGYHIWSIEVQE